MKVDKTALFGGITGALVSLTGMDIASAEHWVNIICAIIGVVIAIISGLVIPLIKWYKSAKEDGKIDADEIAEGGQIIADGLNDIKDELTKKEDNK